MKTTTKPLMRCVAWPVLSFDCRYSLLVFSFLFVVWYREAFDGCEATSSV